MKEEDIGEILVRLQNKIPRIGSVLIKIGDKFYKAKEIG